MKHNFSFGRLILLLMALLLFCPEVRAAPPDPGKTGSIRVRLQDDGLPVPGGSLTAYRVGTIIRKDGVWQYALTPEFAAAGADLQDLQNPELPRILADWADRHNIPGKTCHGDATGLTVFADLTPGVYLIVQDQPPKGYLPVAPFLVTLPVRQDGQWVYDVEAGPKTEILPETKPPAQSDKPFLPQTGQLRWPIPVLAAAGMLLFALGWLLYYKKDDAL